MSFSDQRGVILCIKSGSEAVVEFEAANAVDLMRLKMSRRAGTSAASKFRFTETG
jgi:hypothetical protein